jgi:hypothetical protein
MVDIMKVLKDSIKDVKQQEKEKRKMATKKERKVRISTIPEGETKEQKFLRLATRRVNKVRKAMDQIGLLGGAAYASTEEQREKISNAIRESAEFNLNRLQKVKPGQSDFRL